MMSCSKITLTVPMLSLLMISKMLKMRIKKQMKAFKMKTIHRSMLTSIKLICKKELLLMSQLKI